MLFDILVADAVVAVSGAVVSGGVVAEAAVAGSSTSSSFSCLNLVDILAANIHKAMYFFGFSRVFFNIWDVKPFENEIYETYDDFVVGLGLGKT